MTRSIFGWDLPPGCTQQHIDDQVASGPCDCCCKWTDECVCPECPVCSETGNKNCYSTTTDEKHGLKFSVPQLIGQTKLHILNLKDQIADAEYYIQHLEESELDQ